MSISLANIYQVMFQMYQNQIKQKNWHEFSFIMAERNFSDQTFNRMRIFNV